MSKKLVICADGTWKSSDDRSPTNVVRLHHLLQPLTAERERQVLYYGAGVGTGSLIDRLLGGVTGRGISRNIKAIYRFLAEQYQEGDELYFFGFSRGAYTVRSTVGFIRKCGLLRRDRLHLIDQAYELYRRRDPTADEPDVVAFRRANSREFESVRFIGVWDTVGSLGIPYGWLRRFTARLHEFHDVRLSSRVENGFHAVAIDEHREPFVATLWEDRLVTGQRVEQVWFVGAHSNVGGGYAYGEDLSNIALAWMIERASECGLEFDRTRVDRLQHSYAGSIGRASRFYRWLRLADHLRPIGRGSPGTESVHPSADERLQATHLGYRPRNLLAYRERVAPRG